MFANIDLWVFSVLCDCSESSTFKVLRKVAHFSNFIKTEFDIFERPRSRIVSTFCNFFLIQTILLSFTYYYFNLSLLLEKINIIERKRVHCHYTCDKQVLWESAGAFFPRDNSLVSDRKSHSLNLWPCKSQLLALGIEVN